MQDFVASYICHGKIPFIYTNLQNVNTYISEYNILKKKSCLLILPPVLSEKSLLRCPAHNDKYKFAKILIFIWKLQFYYLQQMSG